MTATEARGPLPAMLRGGAVVTLVVGLLVSLVLAVTTGVGAALNAAAAALVVLAVFAVGVLALAAVLGSGDPRQTSSIAMVGAFVVYGGQLIALTALALLLHDQPWIDRLIRSQPTSMPKLRAFFSRHLATFRFARFFRQPPVFPYQRTVATSGTCRHQLGSCRNVTDDCGTTGIRFLTLLSEGQAFFLFSGQ